MSLEFGKLNFSVSFNPTSAFPLDARSYFESYDAAVAAAATADAAGSSNTIYYYGETIAVVENGVATLYTIQPDKTLAEVGAKIEFNENTFATDADGKVNLYGFADAVAGAQLVKSADGKLSWVKPDNTTIEGIQTTIASIEADVESISGRLDTAEQDITDVTGRVDTAEGAITAVENRATALETKVGAAANGETPATGLFAEVEKKANAADVYTKGDTDTAIATAVAAADHLQRTEVDNVDAIDPSAEGAEKYIYMVSKTGVDGDHYDEYMVINGAVERVGDWAVDLSEYAKTDDVNTALEGKVDKVDGSRLMTNAEGTKLEGIEAGAQVNKIETVDAGQFAIDEDKNLTLLDIAMGKVTGLTDALAGKVDAAEGSRLMTNAEGTKLEGIEAGAQVNKIETVDTEQFAIDDQKNLTLLDITMGKVTGLTDALAGKVDVVEGKGLSTNDLTDELLTKLNNADANVIEAVKLNGVALEVAVDKSVDIIIPIANADAVGTVKSSADENKVSVAADGTMEVNAINVNKLVQTEGDVIVLNGGAAKIN